MPLFSARYVLEEWSILSYGSQERNWFYQTGIKKMKHIRDISGLKFGRLTAVSFDRKEIHGSAYWNCVCECGNTKSIRKSSLLLGLSKSCGCLKRVKGTKALRGRYDKDRQEMLSNIRMHSNIPPDKRYKKEVSLTNILESFLLIEKEVSLYGGDVSIYLTKETNGHAFWIKYGNKKPFISDWFDDESSAKEFFEEYRLKNRACGNPECNMQFIKTHKTRYCSKKCSNAVNSTPYNPKRDRDRLKIYNRAKWLRDIKNSTPEEILSDLLLDPEYSQIVLKLEKQGIDIRMWKPFK